MVYDTLKIFHILCAGILLASIGYSYSLWKTLRTGNETPNAFERIQKQTWLIIAPMAILQLATGFTMVSLKHYDFSSLWISGSVVSFLSVIASWFAFVYFLVMSQQINVSNKTQTSLFYKRAEKLSLYVCKLSLVAMIFFMSTKISGHQ